MVPGQDIAPERPPGKKWAIAMINPGMMNLYYCNIQRGPVGSISICRKEDNAPFNKPATFWM